MGRESNTPGRLFAKWMERSQCEPLSGRAALSNRFGPLFFWAFLHCSCFAQASGVRTPASPASPVAADAGDSEHASELQMRLRFDKPTVSSAEDNTWFTIGGDAYEAKTACLGPVEVGDQVRFERDPSGCLDIIFFDLTSGAICSVYCR